VVGDGELIATRYSNQPIALSGIRHGNRVDWSDGTRYDVRLAPTARTSKKPFQKAVTGRPKMAGLIEPVATVAANAIKQYHASR
jgi:hypothetical protein